MTIFQALILGLVQGVTEFLPISSSGHLVILQQWFGFTESLLTFDIFIHVATLLAILIFFGRSLLKVTFKEWLMVGIGTIPAVIIGLLFKDQIEALFMADAFIGLELIMTGLINFYIDYRIKHPAPEAVVAEQQEGHSQGLAGLQFLNPLKSLVVGVAQAIAIIPAISRSGSTVAAGMAVGLDREAAFRYSFLLAIPALAGAGILQFKDVVETGGLAQVEAGPFAVGFVAALVSGVISLSLFRYVIKKAQLKWFGWYCVILGAILLVSGFLFG